MLIETLVSPHFNLSEVEHSETAARFGYDNTVPTSIMLAIRNTAAGMEKVRYSLKSYPISVSSWYRALLVNRAIGSKDTSQHPKGEAVDFTCPAFGTPLFICRAIMAQFQYIDFDQLILEHTWVHISWNAIPGAVQKNQVLSLLETGLYSNGLTDKKGNQL